MPSGSVFRRTSQAAAAPIPGWDIAIRLDEDLRIGANLIECIEHWDGSRSFILVDVFSREMEGAVTAAFLRGLICSLGVLDSNPVQLMDGIFRELVGRDDLRGKVGCLIAHVRPENSEVHVVCRDHPEPILLSGRPKSSIDEQERGQCLHVGVNDALLLVSRFACAGGHDIQASRAESHMLVKTAQEVMGVGGIVAINASRLLVDKIRAEDAEKWALKLVSMVWIRRIERVP